MSMQAPSGQGDSLETLYVDIAARADQLTQQAEEAVVEVMRQLDRLEDRNKKLEKSYSRLGGFMKQAFSMASGMVMAQVGGSLANAVMNFGKQLISTNAQMQTYTKSFEVLTGSAEEAGEIIEWVKEEAKATPFDVPGLISASQQLMTWGLDLKEWFTIVGDTAAAMNRPLRQVVNAIGTLASGQTGEAIRRFRDLGINLREYTEELKFDARGSLVTPLEEAIPVVKDIMENKFGGMMESQSKTWSGVMSNMQDTWQQFIQVAGEPIFESLNESLFELYEWVDANAENIENFGRTLGAVLQADLDIIMRMLDGVGLLLNLVDEAATKVSGKEDWFDVGTTAGSQVAGIVGGAARGGADLIGGLLGGEGLEEAALSAGAAWRETMFAISGEVDTASIYVADTWEQMVQDATEAMATIELSSEELNEAIMRGIDAVRERYGESLDEASIYGLVAEGQAALDAIDVGRQLSEVPLLGKAFESMTDAIEENSVIARESATVYNEASEQYLETIGKVRELTAAHAELRAEQEANLAVATAVGVKLADKMKDAVESYQETVNNAVQATSDAIENIVAESSAAEAQAIAQHQASITQLRENFAREQIQARKRFNVEWARMLREQNQAVLDAEWEYQHAKDNLLIEGDEIALAELEARYAHEKDVRAREQGDARGDFQARADEQEALRQERFEQQLVELEARLATEIENIRAAAAEEVETAKRALEEKLAHEDSALRERMEKMGELLNKEVGDNQVATDIILEAWRAMYGQQVVDAAVVGMAVRQEMDAITVAAINAAAAVMNVGRVRPTRRGPGGPGGGQGSGGQQYYQSGGYTPDTPQQVTTHPSEFISDADTTAALEGAVGGPLSQTNLRTFADSRRRVDINVNGEGVPADYLNQIYEDITEALLTEVQDVE